MRSVDNKRVFMAKNGKICKIHLNLNKLEYILLKIVWFSKKIGEKVFVYIIVKMKVKI